jgi:hypothetical protein
LLQVVQQVLLQLPQPQQFQTSGKHGVLQHDTVHA